MKGSSFMEITVFGRTIRIFTAEQIAKLKYLAVDVIGSNSWYKFAVFCFCIFGAIELFCGFQRKKGKDLQQLRRLGFFIYIVFMLSALVFSRPAGESSMITWNKSFFMTDRVYHETSLFMAVTKLFMSTIFGIAMKKTFDRVSLLVLVIGAAQTGAIIECMKYFWGRGKAAVGSAILLATGTMIGIFCESIIFILCD